MKISEQWLREWVNPKIDSNQLALQLTMAGLEIDAIIPVANSFENVVIGEVLEVQPHPDADRLRICQVNVGQAAPLTIVCGAANVKKGMKVPTALIGAILSPELIIKKAKLRGVESSGMLCSATELGLAEKSEGLLELPEDAPIGKDIRNYLQLNDAILELKITPNRGDCLSILGLAREVALLNQSKMTPPTFKTISATISDTFPINVSAKKECPRYVGRIIRNINLAKKSPIWLQERLRRSSIRSINPVVDVTNYVMLELGQPLHAFDLQKLSSNIEVRLAKQGEKVSLLNEQEVELDNNTLVIADKQQVQAIAGVMGGNFSGVSSNTRDIFLESAFFQPLTIARTVQRYLLASDSSHRFERGVDPELQTKAIERATQLIIEIVGGNAGPVSEALAENYLPEIKPIHLRRSRIARVLGINIPDDKVKNILESVGMKLNSEQDGWQVTPPSYRFDITLEEDLMEELARIFGYDNIPTHLPTAELKANVTSETEINLSRLRQILINRGYCEAISYSFIAANLQNLFDPENHAKALANPLSQDMVMMRTTLWPGLIQAVIYNQHRQESRIRLFESGLCFIEKNKELLQQPKLAGVIAGSVFPEQWGIPVKPIDFFDLKNDIEALLHLTGSFNEFSFRAKEHPALHPNKSAAIYRNDELIGFAGELHPNVQQTLDLQGPIYLFELNLDNIKKGLLPIFEAVSKFPSVRRDLAMIVDQKITTEDIQKKIINSANELLKSVQLFDIYQGKNIDSGKKSVALGLLFQHPSRTLTDNEINEQMLHIINVLEDQFQAKLRE